MRQQPSFWPAEAGLQAWAVAHMRLVEAADLSCPVMLGANARVRDGMHRVAKARREGQVAIRAAQLQVDPAPDSVGRQPSERPY